ncbi:MAG TPA: prepilin-type N-terminal cleavage/methylation domain-containing protein [Syntrophorhabdaceae bacterium]|nr:prepilin-type N-terminal cleavage/methylation domain-containing protein [Syntrophorhabdaceae bacterium]
MLRNERGLTLLELLISIVLMVTILLIVSGAMRLGYRSVDRGEKKVEHLERYRSSLAIIHAQVQSGMPLVASREGVAKRYYFAGTADSLRIATNYSIWGGQKGHVIVEYRVEADGNGVMSLIASENMVGAEKKNEALLLQGFDAIFFEYFFKDATAQEGRWVDEWSDNAKLPGKIRLRLVQGRKEVSMIIPMRAHGI